MNINVSLVPHQILSFSSIKKGQIVHHITTQFTFLKTNENTLVNLANGDLIHFEEHDVDGVTSFILMEQIEPLALRQAGML